MNAATSDEGPPPLQWRTARQISQETPPEVPWLIPPWVAAGALTAVDGLIKMAGKTTMVMHMVACALEGTEWLGVPTVKTRVVWLTEQPDTSLRAALSKANLLDRDDLTILSFWDARDRTWPEIVGAAIAKAQEVEARLLVVDTLSQWAQLSGDDENSAGAAAAAIEPLQTAAAKHGLAVIIVRHQRKGGGNPAEAARGSTATGGAVDIIVSLRRTGKARPGNRTIEALSRFDETPAELVVELTENGYVVVDSDKTSKRKTDHETDQRDRLTAALPNAHDAALPVPALAEAVKIARSTAQEILSELADAGVASRFSVPGRGRAFRYHAGPCSKCRDNAADTVTPAASDTVDSIDRRPVDDTVGAVPPPSGATASTTGSPRPIHETVSVATRHGGDALASGAPSDGVRLLNGNKPDRILHGGAPGERQPWWSVDSASFVDADDPRSTQHPSRPLEAGLDERTDRIAPAAAFTRKR